MRFFKDEEGNMVKVKSIVVLKPVKELSKVDRDKVETKFWKFLFATEGHYFQSPRYSSKNEADEAYKNLEIAVGND